MDPIVLANRAVQYLIDTPSIPFSADAIYEHMSPLSFPDLYIEGVAAPSVSVADNVVYTSYHDLWGQHTPVCGISRWLAMFQALRVTFPKFWNCTWETFHRRMATVSTTYDQMQHVFLPIIIPISPYDRAEFRGVNYQEYYGYFNLSPPEFLRHILHMVLFGFPVTAPVVEALRLEHVLSHYLQTRLAQGDFDSFLRSGVPATSMFDPNARLRPSSTQMQRLKRIGSLITPMMETQLFPSLEMQDLHTIMLDTDHMGPLTSAVEKLAQQRILIYGDKKYLRYLRRRRGRHTYAMGPRAFTRFLGMGYSAIPKTERDTLIDYYNPPPLTPVPVNPAVVDPAAAAAAANNPPVVAAAANAANPLNIPLPFWMGGAPSSASSSSIGPRAASFGAGGARTISDPDTPPFLGGLFD